MKFNYLNSFIEYRETPWDKNVLKKNTNEILGIQFKDEQELDGAIQEFENHCINNQVGYTNIRVNSSEKAITYFLQKNGYQFIESSIQLKVNIQHLKNIEAFKQLKDKIDIIDYDAIYETDIQQILIDSFSHGRFLEDYNITKEIGHLRNSKWFDQLKRDAIIKVYIYNSQAIGFMCYQINLTGDCNLILGGVSDKYNHLVYPSWSKFIEKLCQETTIRNMNTLVSTSNIGILNLYTKLGFTIEKSYWGFTKRRDFK